MAKLVQHSFSGGEVAAVGRQDLERYARSAKRIRNMLPMQDGSLRKRDGTRHVDSRYGNENSSEERRSRVFAFPSVGDDAYVVEISTQGNFEISKNDEKLTFDMVATLDLDEATPEIQGTFEPGGTAGKIETGMRVQFLGNPDDVEAPAATAGAMWNIAEKRVVLDETGAATWSPFLLSWDSGTPGVKHTNTLSGQPDPVGNYVRFYMDSPDTGTPSEIFCTGYPQGLKLYIDSTIADPPEWSLFYPVGGVHGITEAEQAIFVEGALPNTLSAKWTELLSASEYEIPAISGSGVYADQDIRVWVGGQHPYEAGDVDNITVTASANVMTFFCPGYPTMDLLRYDDLNWQFRMHVPTLGTVKEPTALASSAGESTPTPGETRDYVVTAVDSQTGTEGPPSAALVGAAIDGDKLTWVAPGFGSVSHYNVYAGGNDAFGFIGSSSVLSFELGRTVITPDTTISPSGTTFLPTGSAFMSLPQNVSTGDYWQQRLVLASPEPALRGAQYGYPMAEELYEEIMNRNAGPTRVAMSGSDNYYYFANAFPAINSDGLLYAIASRDPDAFVHVVGAKSLYLFTSKEIWATKGGEAVGVGNPPAFDLVNSFGAARASPIEFGGTVIYVPATDDKIMELGFRFETDRHDASDLTVLHPTAFSSGVRDLAKTTDVVPIVWALRNDGVLVSCTYLPDQQVYAYAFHDSPGGYIESIAASKQNGRDVLYMSVDRGSAGQFIERMFFDEDYEDAVDAVFLDCSRQLKGVLVSGEATTNDPIPIVDFNAAEPMGIDIDPTTHGLAVGDVLLARHFTEPDDPRDRKPSLIHNRRVEIDSVVSSDAFLSYESPNDEVDGGALSGEVHLEDFPDGSPASEAYVAFARFHDSHLAYSGPRTVYNCDGVLKQDTGPGDPINGNGSLISTVGTTAREREIVLFDATTLGTKHGVVVVGHTFIAEVELLEIAPQFKDGTAAGRDKLPTRAKIHLRRSAGGLIGLNREGLHPLQYSVSDAAPAADRPQPLFTGYIEAGLDGAWMEEESIIVRSADHHPFWIDTIGYDVEFGGK